MRLDEPSISNTQGFKVTVNVKNTGKVTGKEVVQVYLTDVVSSVVTPNTFLAGFQKVEIPYVLKKNTTNFIALSNAFVLSAGTAKDVTISISNDQLKLWTLSNNFAVETGQFNVRIGTSDTTYVNATLTVH